MLIRARLELMKHLEGDLEIHPLPAEAGQRRAEITGRVKASSLLTEEEAALLRLVAGGRFGRPASRSFPFRVEVAYLAAKGQ